MKRLILINVNTAERTSLWPNPAADKINITVPSNLVGKKLVLSIQSAAGVVLATKQVTVSGSYLSFDVSSYSKGVYLVRVDENGDVHTLTFVKQ